MLADLRSVSISSPGFGGSDEPATINARNSRSTLSYAARVPQLPEAPNDYQITLDALVERVRTARAHALRRVNEELVALYWEIGREILNRQEREGWGAKVIDRLARDLRSVFPDMGWSPRNLKYMRALAAAWPAEEKVPKSRVLLYRHLDPHDDHAVLAMPPRPDCADYANRPAALTRRTSGCVVERFE
jgi:hypothetical protein